MLEGDKARKDLEHAKNKVPDNALVRSALAEAWELLRHDDEALREANAAAKLASAADIPKEYKLLTKARAAEMDKKWDDAADSYRSLFDLGSQPLEYGLRLAAMEAFGSEKDRALALKTLEELPNDPRVDLARANVYEVLGRSEDQLKAASQVIRRVDDSEYLHMLKANALLSACWAYRELKNLQEAHNACDEASTIFQSSDPVAAAVVLNGVATIEADQGHCQNAKETYDYVIQITGEDHANADHAGALLNAAKMLICLGQMGDARTYLTRSLDASGKADTYDHAAP